ncbi:unnamed protein product [Porites lobata]|uniref:G-protein coupled receptors family 1 profile domain-containing protein n=1 Tax=Porites lobata TaxID=104759 RepID=A0ABN8N3Q2_9CNID|nr:unnamed protein product [Porites lobata]
MLTYCVLNLIFPLVTSVENILVIHALWNASSIPANIKKFFLSLAFSDLAVGLIAQLMSGVMVTALIIAAYKNYSNSFLCPTILTFCYFVNFFLAGASFFNVIAIGIDRFLAITLHLRYRELVTSSRVFMTLVSVWLMSGVAACIYVSLIYTIVKYHQNQIHSELQLSNSAPKARQLVRERKSACNALVVYIVFVTCYLPYLCSMIMLVAHGNSPSSFTIAQMISLFLVFLNSSLNPVIYCWRYHEIKKRVKSTLKKIVTCT